MMVFSSITFVVFFSIVLIFLLALESRFSVEKFGDATVQNIKHWFLLICSYVFYGWWDWRFCFLMFALTFVAYFSSAQIAAQNHVKAYRFIGIVVPLIILGIFKYFNFFVLGFASMFGIDNISGLNIILPVGISFYTFQSMSYTIDVIRGHIKSHSFMNVALYISFFPQLVAGPIVKASDFIPQLKENRRITKSGLNAGIQIFIFGLFKKIVLADHLSVFVDDVFAYPEIFSSFSIILGVISYSLQIYFDFSGYSDMAIGIAKCIGYDFNKNFNMPYISRNVSEFWKRWHISLSTWLQEYLYIPLGGNRRGKIRTYANLLITMLLGGLWHGANITFVVWGFLHGVALCIHKLFKKYHTKSNRSSALATVLSVLITYSFVCICWVFFRAANIADAIMILKKLFVWESGVIQVFSWSVIAIVVVLISHFISIYKSNKNNCLSVNGFYCVLDLNKFWSLVVFFVSIGILLGTAFTDSNPFIYFQF